MGCYHPSIPEFRTRKTGFSAHGSPRAVAGTDSEYFPRFHGELGVLYLAETGILVWFPRIPGSLSNCPESRDIRRAREKVHLVLLHETVASYGGRIVTLNIDGFYRHLRRDLNDEI